MTIPAQTPCEWTNVILISLILVSSFAHDIFVKSRQSQKPLYFPLPLVQMGGQSGDRLLLKFLKEINHAKNPSITSDLL